MGAGNAGGNGGGGRQDAGPNRTVAMNVNTGQTINEKGRVVGSSFISEGANKSNKDIDKLPFSGTKVVASMFKGPLAKGAKYSRSFFENSVIGNTKKGSNITTTKEEFSKMSASKKESLYSGYTKARQSGTKDAYGRDVIGGDGGNDTQTVIKKNIGGSTIQTTAPTEAEVSQSETANADAAALKVKKRGRSMTMMSGAKGVTKTSSDYSLGKKSLLGIV